jgi:hypothetical protein
MIRKITYISFAILLLIASTGFTLSKHYEALSSTAVAAPAIITTQLFIQAFIELISSIVPEVNKVEYVEFISPPPPKMQTVLSGLQTYLL